MSTDAILFEQQGGIATITLNTPDKGNAIDLVFVRRLVEIAMQCDLDPSIRCVVLTGNGRLFCAGGDITLMQSAGDNMAGILSELAGTLHMAVTRLARMPKPLLCLVNGAAAGAGMGLALLGDVVIAARSAKFSVAYGAIGLTPDGGISFLLPRLVGLRKAQELMLTNRRVSADEAEAMGMITRAVDDDALAGEGAKMAMLLSETAVGAVGSVRNLLLGSYGASLEGQMELEARSIARQGSGPEGREGVAAFLGKRKADFTTGG